MNEHRDKRVRPETFVPMEPSTASPAHRAPYGFSAWENDKARRDPANVCRGKHCAGRHRAHWHRNGVSVYHRGGSR